MRSGEALLIDLAAAQAGVEPGLVRTLARRLVARRTGLADGREAGAVRSILNNDGSPLQLCVTIAASGARVRLIADPAADVDDMEARVEAGREVLSAVVPLAGAAGLVPALETTLRIAGPPAGARAQLRAGAFWLALAPGAPGLALYATCSWGQEEQRWPRVVRWLESVLADASPARRLLRGVAGEARPASVGLEGTGAVDGRAKVYFRLSRPRALASLGVERLCDPGVSQFLAQVVEGRDLSLAGLLFGLGFSLATGELVDVKVDVCGHCVPRSSRDWTALIESLVPGSEGLTVLDALIGGRTEVAFLGQGLDHRGRRRLNLYLKACDARR